MSTEKVAASRNGWAVLTALIIIDLAIAYSFYFGVVEKNVYVIIPTLLVFTFTMILYNGFFTIEPNAAVALIFFGKYVGTDKESGFRCTNPLYKKTKISLRARSFDGNKLKVNDKKGNPIEISAVIVWHVKDTAQALFDVENYHDYVIVQSESALRHLATSYAYDNTDGEETSLRSSIDEVSSALEKEIQNRVMAAGVIVNEARINHLSYAPEIAGSMLQRQQAEAIIAARTKIVDGAVGMVQMALNRLKEDGVVQLDEERKANMVSNLLVVLCGERSTQPIINAGSLY